MRPCMVVLPGTALAFGVNGCQLVVQNTSAGKPIFVRVGAKSITVSDRKPAHYGKVKGE